MTSGRADIGRRQPRVGDVLAIPLPDGRTAYGQYVFKDEKLGPLIWIFAFFGEGENDPDDLLERLAHAGILLGPVITGVGAAVRSGLWRIVGKMPIVGFEAPRFLNVIYDNYIPRGPWWLWEGQQQRKLGSKLPKEYKHLEFLLVWDPQTLAKRIATGENPYGAMIREATCQLEKENEPKAR